MYFALANHNIPTMTSPILTKDRYKRKSTQTVLDGSSLPSPAWIGELQIEMDPSVTEADSDWKDTGLQKWSMSELCLDPIYHFLMYYTCWGHLFFSTSPFWAIFTPSSAHFTFWLLCWAIFSLFSSVHHITISLVGLFFSASSPKSSRGFYSIYYFQYK